MTKTRVENAVQSHAKQGGSVQVLFFSYFFFLTWKVLDLKILLPWRQWPHLQHPLKPSWKWLDWLDALSTLMLLFVFTRLVWWPVFPGISMSFSMSIQSNLSLSLTLTGTFLASSWGICVQTRYCFTSPPILLNPFFSLNACFQTTMDWCAQFPRFSAHTHTGRHKQLV